MPHWLVVPLPAVAQAPAPRVFGGFSLLCYDGPAPQPAAQKRTSEGEEGAPAPVIKHEKNGAEIRVYPDKAASGAGTQTAPAPPAGEDAAASHIPDEQQELPQALGGEPAQGPVLYCTVSYACWGPLGASWNPIGAFFTKRYIF